MAGLEGDPNTDLVLNIKKACESITSLPLAPLSDRFVTLMKMADGVAQTFFGSKPESMVLNGPTPADVTGIITTSAVIHVCKTISQTSGMFDFNRTVKAPDCCAASDNFLGVNSELRANAQLLANSIRAEMIERITFDSAPTPVVYEQAVQWTPMSNPAGFGAPSNYLAGALLDDWIHSFLLQTCAQLSNGWQTLKETPGLLTSFINYLSHPLNQVVLLNQATLNPLGLQLILYISYRLLDCSTNHPVSATLNALASIAREKQQLDPASLLLETVWKVYVGYLGLIQGTTLQGSMIERMQKDDPFKTEVMNAASAELVSVHWEPIPGLIPSAEYGPVPPPILKITEITYGAKLLEWLDRDGQASAKSLGLRSNERPNNLVSHVDASQRGSSGCFVPGTLVLLADGSSIPIEEIKEGDAILCRSTCDHQNWSRSIGTASSERVVATSSRPYRVFGFNHGKPFFTAEHVFFTTTGLRALDPAKARAENPWLQVGLLRPHDVVKRATEDGRYVNERIEHFTSAVVTGSVHGVHLREGLRSYHANGYLVFLNYPELTLQRMMGGLHHLPVSKQMQFFSDFERAEDSMARVVGPFLPEAVRKTMAAVTSHEALLAAKTHEPGEPAPPGTKHLALHNVHATFILRTHVPEGTGTANAAALHPAAATHVALSRGRVFVNDELVKSAKITRDQVHWTRPVPGPADADEVHFEHGAIQLYPHRRAGFGRLVVLPAATTYGNLSNDASSVPGGSPVVDFIAEASTLKYKTWVSADPVPLASLLAYDDGSGNIDSTPITNWTEGPDFMFGVGEESCKAQIFAADGKLLHMEAFFGTSNGGNLSVHLLLSGEGLRFDMNVLHQYKRMIATMSDDSMSFCGIVVKYDPSGNDYEGAVHFWKGQYVDEPNSTPADASSAAQPLQPAMPASGKLAAAGVAHVSASSASPAMTDKRGLSAFALGKLITDMHEAHLITVEPHPITASLLADSPSLSVKNLCSMVTPSDKEYNQVGTSLLREAMKYHLPDDLRTLFFQAARPVESSLQKEGLDLVNITAEQKDFLCNKFGVAYLTRMVSNSSNYSEKYSEEEKKKLDFYLKGSGVDNCLASDRSYGELNTIAQALAFRQLFPALDAYVNDTTKDWAEELYKHLTTGPSWVALVNQVLHTLEGPALLQKYCLMLYCLSKPGGNRRDLDVWRKFKGEAPMKHIRPLHQGGDDIPPIADMEDLFVLILIHLQDPSGDQEPVLRRLHEDFMLLDQKFREDEAKTQVENAKALAHALDDLRRDAMSFMVRHKAPQWQRLRAWVESLTEESPLMAKYGKIAISAFTSIFGFGLLCASIIMSIRSLASWDSLPDEQKASIVTQVIADGTKLLEKVGVKGFEALTGRTIALPSEDAAVLADAERTVAESESNLARGAWEQLEDIDFGSALDSSFIDIVTDETAATVSKIFSISGKIARGLGVVALVAASVLAGIEIGHDVADGTDTANKKLKLAMDSLQLFSTSMLLVAELASIAAADTMAMVLGPVGVVVGIVALIIGFFIRSDPPPPPPDPVQKFIDNKSKPFLSTVKVQPYPDPVKSVRATLQQEAAGDTTALVKYEPPDYHGSTSITTFTVAAFEVGPGAELASGVPTQVVVYPATEVVMKGLKPGKSYTFHVAPSNGNQGDVSAMAQKYVSSNIITVPKAS